MASATKDKATPVVTGYSTQESLFATAFKQGGRTVYSVALTPDQLINLVPQPNPDATNPGNRKIRPKHASDFAAYFEDHDDWVIPGIILRASSIFSFEQTNEVEGAKFGVLSYSKRDQSKIQILDGQHRILGFHLAHKDFADKIDKAISQMRQAERVEGKDSPLVKQARAAITALEKKRDRLFDERVTVEIHVTDDMSQYRQMFYDIADNALGITAAVKARFDSRKVVNRALPAVLEHPLLLGRVEMELDRIGAANPNLMSARHVIEIIRSLTVGLEGRVGKRMEEELSDTQIEKDTLAFLDLLVESFPAIAAVQIGQILPAQLRSISILGSALFIRILAGVHWSLTTEHGFSRDMVKDYFQALSQHTAAPVHENSIWIKNAPEGVFDVGSTAPSGRRQDSGALNKALIDWAVDKEKFVTDPPAPAPEPVVDPDEGIDFAPNHDTNAIAVEERNAIEEIAKRGKARAKRIATK